MRISAAEAEAATLRAQITENDQAHEAETASLRERIAELEHTRTDESETREMRISAAEAEAATLRAQIAQNEQLHEAEAASLRDRVAELERTRSDRSAAAEAEAATLRVRIAQNEQSHEAETTRLRERIAELEYARDARIAEAESAAAELRSRLAEREHAHALELVARDSRVAEAERVASELRAQMGELDRAWADDLRVARERIGALENELVAERGSFDQKLNTIVVHLAQDHEADLGKAVEEREEARAEARSLNMRVTALQKKSEEDKHALEDATRLLADIRRAAQEEIDKLRARIAELEHKPKAEKPRILIAHPDAELRKNARASLERAGYEIVSAADGLEALRTAIAQRPAVVIADAVMPKMDGRELCQLLKSQEKTAHIRVILLTRATDEPPKGDLLPDEVLKKPVPLETLKSTLAALLA